VCRRGSSNEAGAGQRRRGAGGSKALKQLLPLLLRVAGRKVLIIALLAVARTALSNRLARLQGFLFRAAFLRRVPLFARNLAGAAVVGVLQARLPPPWCSVCGSGRTAHELAGLRGRSRPGWLPTSKQQAEQKRCLVGPPLLCAENLALCGVAAALEATSRSWVSRMELQWRRLLTDRLHGTYFADMVGGGCGVGRGAAVA